MGSGHNESREDRLQPIQHLGLEGSCYPLAQGLLSKAEELHAREPKSRVYLLTNRSGVVLPFMQHPLKPIVILPLELRRRIETGSVRDGDWVINSIPLPSVENASVVAEISAPNPYAPNEAPLKGRIIKVGPKLDTK